MTTGGKPPTSTAQEWADEVYLPTYTLFQGKRQTRRATIWQRTDIGWKMVFHQGTVVVQGS
jgi:hypothetical protein